MSVTCAFCSEAGHLAWFCPSQPTVVPEAGKIKFVEALLAAPREDTKQYEGVDPEEVMRRVSARAAELNAGNPFTDSELRRDMLRGQAGMWKAIGVDAVTLSWICYGYDLHLDGAPGQFTFDNTSSYKDHAEAVEPAIQDALRDGSFRPVHPDFAHVVNPILLEPKEDSVDGWRLCHNMQYPNAFAAKAPFKQRRPSNLTR